MRKVAKRTIERECPAGVARTAFVVAVSMNGSSVEGKEPHVDPCRRALVDPEPSL